MILFCFKTSASALTLDHELHLPFPLLAPPPFSSSSSSLQLALQPCSLPAYAAFPPLAAAPQTTCPHQPRNKFNPTDIRSNLELHG